MNTVEAHFRHKLADQAEAAQRGEFIRRHILASPRFSPHQELLRRGWTWDPHRSLFRHPLGRLLANRDAVFARTAAELEQSIDDQSWSELASTPGDRH